VWDTLRPTHCQPAAVRERLEMRHSRGGGLLLRN